MFYIIVALLSIITTFTSLTSYYYSRINKNFNKKIKTLDSLVETYREYVKILENQVSTLEEYNVFLNACIENDVDTILELGIKRGITV
jgi:hypothetical protein